MLWLPLCGSGFAIAQAGPSPSPAAPRLSLVDVYAGYGAIEPLAKIFSSIGGIAYQPVHNINVTASASYYFGKHLGLQAEGEYFNGPNVNAPLGPCVTPACFFHDPQYYKFEAGPVVRFARGRFVPFTHLLAGGARMNGPALQPLTWGLGATAGGGLDYVLPVLSDHLALRAQADLEGSHIVYGPQNADRISGGVGDLLAFKASGGLVVRAGGEVTPLAVSLACQISPPAVYQGDVVAIQASAMNLNAKRAVRYVYTSSGGKVSRAGDSATVNTAGLQPGSYTVTGWVEQGTQPAERASCGGTFRVKPFEPPTITCTASPANLISGDSSTITADGASPGNRALSYSYSTSAGMIQENSSSATLLTSGIAPGKVQVTCNVVDDRGLAASAVASVMVSSPPAAAKPAAQTLCTVGFARDLQRPTRVDNEGKACLDDLALSLQRSTDAQLALVGNAASGEAGGKQRAAQRAVNVKQYLVHSKGLDPARIGVFTGDQDARSVTTTLVPTGASLPAAAWPVDEKALSAEVRKPLPVRRTAMRKHGRRRAKAKVRPARF